MSNTLALVFAWMSEHPVITGTFLTVLFGAWVNWATYKRTPTEWAQYQQEHPWKALAIRLSRIAFPHLRKIPQLAPFFPQDPPASGGGGKSKDLASNLMQRTGIALAILACAVACARVDARAPVTREVARDASINLGEVVNDRVMQRCAAVWVSEDILVTAAHCVPGAELGSVWSYWYDHNQHGARFLAANEGTDVAALQVSMPAPPHSWTYIVHAPDGVWTSVFDRETGEQAALISDGRLVTNLSKGSSGGGVFWEKGLAGIVTRRSVFGGTGYATAEEVAELVRAAEKVKLIEITPNSWEDPL